MANFQLPIFNLKFPDCRTHTSSPSPLPSPSEGEGIQFAACWCNRRIVAAQAGFFSLCISPNRFPFVLKPSLAPGTFKRNVP